MIHGDLIMKHKYLYIFSGILVILYIFCLSLTLKVEHTHSYKMYYIERKVRWWGGNDGLLVNFDSEYSFKQSSQGYQYLGKDFEFLKIENKKECCKEINILEESTIYYQIKKEDLDKKYKVVLKTGTIGDNEFQFVLNNKEINGNIFDDYIEIIVENTEEYNSLEIRSEKNIELVGLAYKEI